MFATSYSVDESWLDPIYKHVHHARCLELLEFARIAYLESIGCSYNMMLERGEALVITSVDARYKRELKRGVVELRCLKVEIEDRIVRIYQDIQNVRKKTVMEATIELAFMNLQTRRAMAPPNDFRSAVFGEE